MYWGLFALGRLSAVPLSLVLAPLTMTVFDLVGAIVSIVVLFSLSENGSIDHLSFFYLLLSLTASSIQFLFSFEVNREFLTVLHFSFKETILWVLSGVFGFSMASIFPSGSDFHSASSDGDVFSHDESASLTWLLIVYESTHCLTTSDAHE